MSMHSVLFTATATALAALLAGANASAEEFINRRGIPDSVLTENLERLINYVATKELNPEQGGATVTRILGKEDLGFSKVKVWFCVRRSTANKKVDACGNDVRLIRLDSGVWILEDEKSGTWIVAQE